MIGFHQETRVILISLLILCHSPTVVTGLCFLDELPQALGLNGLKEASYSRAFLSVWDNSNSIKITVTSIVHYDNREPYITPAIIINSKPQVMGGGYIFN